MRSTCFPHERHIFNPFLIVSFADGSYYIEVWDERSSSANTVRRQGGGF